MPQTRQKGSSVSDTLGKERVMDGVTEKKGEKNSMSRIIFLTSWPAIITVLAQKQNGSRQQQLMIILPSNYFLD